VLLLLVLVFSDVVVAGRVIAFLNSAGALFPDPFQALHSCCASVAVLKVHDSYLFHYTAL